MIDFTRFSFRVSRIASNLHFYQRMFQVLCWISKRYQDEKGKITFTVSNNLMRGIIGFRQPLKTFNKEL